MWPRISNTSATTRIRRRFFHGSHQAELQGVRGRLRPRGPLRLRPLLRPARGRLRARRRRTSSTRAGASRAGRRTSGATTTSCRSRARQPRTRTGLPAGCTPLMRADRLAAAPGPARGVGQERRRQPHALLQGPRRLGRRHARPRARLHDARLRLDRQPRQLGRRPRRRAGDGHLRLHPVRPRGAEDPRHRHLRDQAGQGQGHLRRRQPAVHRAQRRARLGLRQRQHAPVLLRGLQDARLRGRRAARLGGARPRRGADRLGLAVHEDRQGLRGLPRPRPRRGRAPGHERRPGRRLLAGGHGLRGRRRRLQARAARHDRQVAGHRQPGRRPLRARARAPQRRRDRLGLRRRDPRRHPPAGRDDRHLHRDRRRRDHRGAGQAGRARRHRPRRARRAHHHRRGPQDARRRPRDVRGLRDRRPPSTSSCAEVEGAEARV